MSRPPRRPPTEATIIAPSRVRVNIANPADGGVFYWLAKLVGFLVIATLICAAFTMMCTYSYFSINAPPVPDLRNYSKVAPAVSHMYAADGTKLGEFAKEWREIVPFENLPKPLVNAFLAVEDHDFFGHRGLYFKGVARAAWTNITAGDFAQGGSTITQQVAKQFLGAEKSLSRKGKEAIVARRLEAQYSKKAILSVYLNHIYLGAGAWGVGAAAKRYFQKRVDQLTLAESALIAGLAKAPTKFSPIGRADLARDRRNVVLDKMATYGFATQAEVDRAKAEPITLSLYREVFPDRMPYYAEHVRRYILEKYKTGLFEQGLRIETAAEPTWEAGAYENADFGARHQDKRQGWRGPEWRVDGLARDTFLARQRALYGTGPLDVGRRYLAVVDKVDGEHAEVLIGDRRLQLPLRTMRWASPWQAGNAENDVEIDSANRVVKPGYVVWVTREVRTLGRYRDWYLPDKKNPSWMGRDDQHEWDASHDDVVRLEQVPHPQATIFTADHHNGYVVAMVGGYDYDRSVFNRAVQACRQPGSTYKPIYYALGLDEGYGFDTVLNDVPVVITDPDTGETWTPTNLGDSMDGDVTLEYALVFSKNIPSVDLFQQLSKPPLGSKAKVEGWIRKLGFSTKLFVDDALALGASCSKLDEMARAFTVFARNGAWWPRANGTEKNWVYVRRILDRAGNTVEDNTAVDDPQLAAADRFDRFAAVGGVTPVQAIPARAAFLMTKLLASEVEYGFANVLRATEVEAAGKTGTSSATHDNTFIAFTPKYTTLVWLGDDQKERALGKNDAAYMTAVPMWSRYMFEETKNYPRVKIPWAVPPGVNPNDRGDHSKGRHGPQMDLIFRAPPKKDADDGTGSGSDAPPDDKPPG
ncbi:MAG: transglycosylase domain-containing protein [Proteobacteria bacterium]|nr:transglycosylase domain-containing protein [Pseudomonadota bacterium]